MAAQTLHVDVTSLETRLAWCAGDKVVAFDVYSPKDHVRIGSLFAGHVRHIDHASRLAIIEGPNFLEAALPSHELGLPKLEEGMRVVFQSTKRPDLEDGKRMEGKRAWSLQLGPFVYTPFRTDIGFSKRIPKETQALLKASYQSVWPQSKGLLIRSSIARYGEGAAISALKSLLTWAKQVDGAIAVSGTIGLLHSLSFEDMYVAPLPYGASIIVDDAPMFNGIKHYVARIRSDVTVGKGVAFEGHHEEAWDALFSTHVPIDSGGTLIVEEVAALTAIDINKAGCTDAWVVFHTRAFEAAGCEIVRRDLGGLIVIDPAGRVKDPKAVSVIVAALNNALQQSDRPYRLLGWTASGLFELTREKNGPSLVKRLTVGGACVLAQTIEAKCGAVLRIVKRKNHDGGAPSILKVPGPLYYYLHDKGVLHEPGSLVTIQLDGGAV